MKINDLVRIFKNSETSASERVEERSENGKVLTKSIFKDVNGDGKEDLYSFTRNRYDSNGNFVESVTYKDLDGDGVCDTKTVEKADGSISSGGATEFQNLKTENYKRNFNNLLKLPQVNQSHLSEEQLEAYGFEKGKLMDMNGGVYYTNKKTGETVRVGSDGVYTYTKGNITHEQYGERGGQIIVDYGNGNKKRFFYELDKDGNKVLTNVTEEKTPTMAKVSQEITNIKSFEQS